MIQILGESIPPFTWLIAAGMVLCFFLAQRRVKRVGLFAPHSAVALVWVAIGGFIGAHVLEVLAYHPERLLRGPQTLFAIWEGFSSFGGFIGGTVGIYLYCRLRGIWMLPYIDAQLYGYAPGWIIARGGCFVSHDHLGLRSDFVLAVAYPDGARHNLGFYEVLVAAGITLVLYAPARFMLDLLRTGDRRYFGLTAAQYLCFAMLGLAVYLIVKGRARGDVEPASTV